MLFRLRDIADFRAASGTTKPLNSRATLNVEANRVRSNSMRVLIVEDEKRLAANIAAALKQGAGLAVDCAHDGREGVALAENQHYDLLLLDLMLPGLDGLSLVQEMRKNKIMTPVLILSAKATVDDRVRGLHSGGDDYLTKPFAFDELLARVQALVRRGTGTAEPSTLTHGDLTLDLMSRKVARAGTPIDLQAREFALLEFLMRNAGRVVTKTMILSHVWDYSFDPQTNVVDVLVCRVRNKVDKGFDKKLIKTLRGMGYVLDAS